MLKRFSPFGTGSHGRSPAVGRQPTMSFLQPLFCTGINRTLTAASLCAILYIGCTAGIHVKEVHRTNGFTVKIYKKGEFFMKNRNELRVIVF